MSDIKLRGSVQVFTEISEHLAAFGDTNFSADRSMLVYWAGLLADELASEIAAGIPEVKRAVEAYEQAKKIPASLLRQTVTAPHPPVATPPTAELTELLDALINAVEDCPDCGEQGLDDNGDNFRGKERTAAVHNAVVEYVEREIQSAYDRGYADA